MNLQRREKILAGAALGVVGLAVSCFFLLTGDGRTDHDLLDEQAKLTVQIANKQKLLQDADREQARFALWRRCALPPEPVLARSLYQNWLHGLTGRANFHDVRLAANDAGTRRDQYTRISFALDCRAKLGDVIQFMYEFYSAGYLHQIRKMDIRPSATPGELDVDIAIDALSLAAAESKEKLPPDAGHSLQFAKLADYRDPIVARNLFTAFVRPASPDEQKVAGNDPAASALVTGFTQVDGSWQVWIEDRGAGKRWALESGESFNIGGRKCTVQTIRGEGDVIVELDRCRRLLRLGDNLRGGVEIRGSVETHDGRQNTTGEGSTGATKRPPSAHG
jgi:hypothetical protein